MATATATARVDSDRRHLGPSLVAMALPLLIATRVHRRRSLDLSGAIAGFFLVSLHLAASYRYRAVLLAFSSSSSKLTKVGQELKRGIDEHFKEGGQRNWIQVLANSGLATILAIEASALTGGEDKCLDANDRYTKGSSRGI